MNEGESSLIRVGGAVEIPLYAKPFQSGTTKMGVIIKICSFTNAQRELNSTTFKRQMTAKYLDTDDEVQDHSSRGFDTTICPRAAGVLLHMAAFVGKCT